MSIRINLENKTFNKESNLNHEYDECSEGDGDIGEKINTPRQSIIKINDLSKKIASCNSSSRTSKINPSTTDKLSNYSLNSNISNNIKKNSPYEAEKEFVIEECPGYKIRTPVNKDSPKSTLDLKQIAEQELFSKSQKKLKQENNIFKNPCNSNFKINYPELNCVVKNLNEDFNKLKHDCSTSRDSKQYNIFYKIFAVIYLICRISWPKKITAINLIYTKMIKINSKDKNNINNVLDKGFISDRFNDEKRMNELTDRVNSMIKSQQETQINSKRNDSCYSANSNSKPTTCFQKFCPSK